MKVVHETSLVELIASLDTFDGLGQLIVSKANRLRVAFAKERGVDDHVLRITIGAEAAMHLRVTPCEHDSGKSKWGAVLERMAPTGVGLAIEKRWSPLSRWQALAKVGHGVAVRCAHERCTVFEFEVTCAMFSVDTYTLHGRHIRLHSNSISGIEIGE